MPRLQQGASRRLWRLSWVSGGPGMNRTIALGGNTPWLPIAFQKQLVPRHSAFSPGVSPIVTKPLSKGAPQTPRFQVFA